MARKKRSKKISAGMKKYHAKTTRKKSNAGVRKAARKRWSGRKKKK